MICRCKSSRFSLGLKGVDLTSLFLIQIKSLVPFRDCFYVQVERQRDPSLVGVPCAVVQYNKWMGGGIIALSYEAKKAGVKRSMRGDEASKICPAIRLVTVPVHHEKADLTRYRDAGTAVFELLGAQEGDMVCERTSIDEAYVDVTALAAACLPTLEARLAATAAAPPATDVLAGTHVVGMERGAAVAWLRAAAAGGADEEDTWLVAGAVAAARFRRAVRATLGYTLSAGIAHNRMLAKHASGMHKPFQQTLVRTAAVPALLAELEIGELNGFGGKKGKELREHHDVRFVADLQRFRLTQLERIFGATEFAQTAYDACRGICHKEVKQKVILDSVGNSKTFNPPLTRKKDVEKYLGLLSEEVFARLETISIKHKRKALKINVSISRGKELVTRKGVEVSVAGGKNNVASKSAKMSQAEKGPAGLAKLAISLVQPLLEFATEDRLNVTSLGLIASELEEIPNQASMITRYLKIANRSSADTFGDASVINVAKGGNGDLATKTKPKARQPQAALAKEQCRKTGVIAANDVDPDTLKELPAELRASTERQISVQSVQAKDRPNRLHFNKLTNNSPPLLGQTKRKRTAGDISAQCDRRGSIATFLRPKAGTTAQRNVSTADAVKTAPPKLLPVLCSEKLNSSSTDASGVAHRTSSPAAVPGAVAKESSAATTAHWACESCTFVNPPAYLICDMCHSLKQSPHVD